jgi:glycosyltransferase involved in cell wall biosynthesis
MKFLSIYVPTYKRPRMLERCLASIFAQSDKDFEVVLVRDEIGIGIDGMYADIPNHLNEVHGEYVFVLSDDNLITDADFVSNLKQVARSCELDVIVFKNKIVGTLPDIWNAAPQEGHIDLSCFAVKADVWKANADKWGKCYAGDYHFIRSLWDQGFNFCWWNVTPIMAMQISRGAPE